MLDAGIRYRILLNEFIQSRDVFVQLWNNLKRIDSGGENKCKSQLVERLVSLSQFIYEDETRWKETEWKKEEFNSTIVKRFIVDLLEMNISFTQNDTKN